MIYDCESFWKIVARSKNCAHIENRHPQMILPVWRVTIEWKRENLSWSLPGWLIELSFEMTKMPREWGLIQKLVLPRVNWINWVRDCVIILYWKSYICTIFTHKYCQDLLGEIFALPWKLCLFCALFIITSVGILSNSEQFELDSVLRDPLAGVYRRRTSTMTLFILCEILICTGSFETINKKIP